MATLSRFFYFSSLYVFIRFEFSHHVAILSCITYSREHYDFLAIVARNRGKQRKKNNLEGHPVNNRARLRELHILIRPVI
jgi:hypothetical protein